MDKFRPIKKNSVESKTRTGSKPTARLKTSTFLPSVFRNPINQKWLDATMDNMISKGDLERFDGFVGSYDSSTIETVGDVYVNTGNKKQLSPSIISTNPDGTISDTIDFNNILNSISFNFEDTGYNLNQAYRANKFVYNPPIDLDMFANYQQYYWCPNLPTLELDTDSQVSFLEGKPYGIIAYGDKSIDLFNGLKVKFNDNIVYTVGGVGHSVKFLQREDNLNELGKDYILIERSDSSDTMWSKYSFWFHHSALHTLSLHIEDMDVKQFKNAENQAYRPIIEFWPEMELMPNQTKTKLNQEPLFQLVDETNTYLGDYYESNFTGNKIFSYVHGSGKVDDELGFSLKYKNIGYRSEYLFENSINSKTYVYGQEFSSFENKILGTYFYKINGKAQSVYKKSAYGFGTKTKTSIVTTADHISNGMELPVGYLDWRVQKEIIVQGDATVTSFEKTTGDNWNLCFEDQTDITIGSGVQRVFRDLTLNGNLGFWEEDETGTLVNVEDTNYVGNIVVARSGNVIEVLNTNPSGSIFYYGTSTDNLNKIFVIEGTSQDEYFHTVTIEGTPVLKDQYVVNGDSISIPSDLLREGGMVDIEYYDANSDISKSSEVPEVLQSNATNKIVDQFTLSETFNHWESLITSIPNIKGEAIGSNNYHKIQKTLTYGGTISLTDENSIMYDMCYSNPNMNVTQALYEQGRDWWSFRKRFTNQLQRQFKTKTFDSARDLVNSTLDNFKNSKSNKDIHTDSNMIYSDTFKDKTYDYPEDGIIHIIRGYNRDYFKGDHVYVHLFHNRDENDSPITELLVRDVDYTIEGSTIVLTKTATPFVTNTIDVKVIVSHHNHYDECFVPASLAKLGLSKIYKPQIVGSKLYCHDGHIVDIAQETIDLYNTRSQYFNPVISGLWELENRIYDNMVKTQGESFSNFLDTTQRDHVDSHLEYFFADYVSKNNIVDDREYDANDPKTWNYKTVSHVGGWQGCYIYNFATHTPHITPWHMFGYTTKPNDWDEKYSWTDPSKREALISDLKISTVNNLYVWDWDNLCPVDENGNLLSPQLILGSPDQVDAAEDFVFGDWSPSETEWRLSSIGQAIALDAMLKLNPTNIWNKIFNVGVFDGQYISSSFIDRSIVSPKSSIVHGSGLGKKVKEINLISSSDQYAQYGDTLEMYFVTDNYVKHADIDLQIKDGKIENINLLGSGSGYEMVPSIVLIGESNGIKRSVGGFEVNVVLEDNNQWVGGLSHIQRNYLVRNQLEQDMESFYKSIHTRLTQNLNGYTAQHMVNVSTETGPVGKFALGFNDYEIILNQDVPNELIVASAIEIEKTDSGYIVDGYSKHKQMFKYLQPTGRNANDYKVVELSSTTTVKKFNSFSDKISYVEFGHKFARIQDVYDFIRGYYQYLTVSGFVFDTDGDSKALEFAQWAIAADVDQYYTVSIGSSLSFDSEFGVVQKFGELPGSYNSILVKDSEGKIVDIEYSDLCITRKGTQVLLNPRVRQIDVQGESIVQVVQEGTETFKSTETQWQEYQDQETVSVSGKTGEIVSAAVSVIYFDHYLVLDNKTKFNEIIFDDVLGSRHNRIKISGEKTKNWNGSTMAPGYIVSGNTIIQNFDSLIDNASDFYNLDVSKFNKDIQEVENMTLGNVSREWVNTLGLDSNTVNKFFQGVIKRKGTRDNIERIGRSNFVNGGNSNIDVNEEWMFRHSYYGDTIRNYATEIKITNDDIIDNSLVLNLNDNDIEFVNNEKTPVFSTVDIATFNSSFENFYTGGSVMIGESDYTVTDVDDLLSIDIEAEDWSKIPSWSGKQEYFRGDIVRKDGMLLKCNVDVIPYVRESETVSVTKSVSQDTLVPYGHVMTIDGVDVSFESTRPNWQDIIVSGSDYDGITDPLRHGDVININNVPIVFEKFTTRKVLKGQPDYSGTPNTQTPAIYLSFGAVGGSADVTNSDPFVINGNMFDLKQHATETVNTPSDVTLTFTATWTTDGAPNSTSVVAGPGDDTFAVGQNIEANILGISKVLVDGTEVPHQANYGTDEVTLDTPLVGGETVEISFQRVDNSFEIPSQYDLSGNWSIASTDTTPYSDSGQTITFTELEQGSQAQVTLTHAFVASTYTMTNNQFASMISSLPNFSVLNNNIDYTPTSLTDKLEVSSLPEFGITATSILASDRTTAYYIDSQVPDFGSEFDVTEINDIVNQLNAGLSSVTLTATGGPIVASRDGNKIVITENVNPLSDNDIDPNYRISFTGSATDKLGLQTTFINFDPNTPIPTSNSVSDVVSFINDAGIPQVSASYGNGVFVVSSENSTMEITGTNTTVLLDFPTGVFSQPRGLSENVFTNTQWSDISETDDALASYWIVDDGKLGNAVSNGITNKFFGWNYQKFQPMGGRAEIIKGDETDRGNDAVVRIIRYVEGGSDTEINHNVEVGDYVMFLNTTTVPSTVGIHMVTDTQVSTSGYTFTIDKYIDTDGIADGVFVLRNRRFRSTLEFEKSKETSRGYSYVHGDLVYVDENENGQPSEVVYQYDSLGNKFSDYTGSFQGQFNKVRELSKRVMNDRIENVVIYDAASNETIRELEVFDPLRGIIPGVARKEIDFISAVDLAIYSDSTDENVTLSENNSWGEAEVGTVWWDTRTVKYIDYEQGDDEYKRQYWGEQTQGSRIDVWEWTKSSVPPQDWAEKVEAKSLEFGYEASGEAFAVYEKETDSFDYYYTEEMEYDRTFDRYESVYYFWVKNKTTTSDENRSITVTEIASIINDPSANGISWCAATSETTFIGSGVDRYLNDESTILQITMKPDNIDHESWTVIAENKDLIPDYWYIGLEDNLVGTQRVTGNPLPASELNEFNRYGDNRRFKYNNKYYSQSWFRDVWDARKEAVLLINRMLVNQNVTMERADTWDRIITKVHHPLSSQTIIGTADHPSDEISRPLKGTSYYNEKKNELWFWTRNSIEEATADGWYLSPGYDMNRTWEWTDYINENYSVTSDPSINVYTKEELEAVDKNKHQIVRFVKGKDHISRDETYLLVDNEWVLIKKRNGTIQFNDLVWNKFKQIGWDTKSWEASMWDMDVGYFMGLIIKACREDLFIGQDIQNFNKLFFGMVKYTASLHDQVDWFYKTTYIRLDVETDVVHDVINRPTKYRRNGIDTVIEYTNTIKPYHTKIRTMFDENFVYEDVNVTMTEVSVMKDINVDLPEFANKNEILELRSDTHLPSNQPIIAKNDKVSDYRYVDNFDDEPTYTNDWQENSDIDLIDVGVIGFEDEVLDEQALEFNFVSNLNNKESNRRFEINTIIDESLDILIDKNDGDSILYIQDTNLNYNVFKVNEDETLDALISDEDVRDTKGSYTPL